MIKTLDLPVVVVVKPEAGMINQTLMTINHAEAKGIKVRGVINNNFFAKRCGGCGGKKRVQTD